MSSTKGTLTFAERGELMGQRFLAPYIVLISVAETHQAPSARLSIAEVERVCFGRGDGFEFERQNDGGKAELKVRIADGWMSTRHAELLQKGAKWILRDLGSKNGTFLAGETISEVELNDGDVFEIGNSFWLFCGEGRRSNRDLADCVESDLSSKTQVERTLSIDVAHAMADLKLVAESSVPILIGGDTGTGKEGVARFVHDASLRKGAFIPVNCGGLSKELIASELFGHCKGAFSGAIADKKGYFQDAKNGTVFLDEIAELPIATQASLLRVLQEKEVTPVGESRGIPVDFRLVAATHRNLDDAVSEGTFRADLLERIRGHQTTLLGLRERRDDLGLLINVFLKRVSTSSSLVLSRPALRALVSYPWPGNIRELEQSLSAASALAKEGRIERHHLPQKLQVDVPLSLSVEDGDLRKRLVDAMEKHNGNVSAVARELDKARVQIRRWCKRLDIDTSTFKK